MSFVLHPRLESDSLWLGDWALCQLRLHRDARWPWLILVPRRADLRELGDLNADDRARLIEELNQASGALAQLFRPDKINVGMLGNIVAQMHWHVVARHAHDAAWPGPIWGQGTATAYAPQEIERRARDLRAALSL